MIHLRNGLSVVNAAIACSVVLTTTSEATANNEDKPSSTSSETKTTVEKPFVPRKLHDEHGSNFVDLTQTEPERSLRIRNARSPKKNNKDLAHP